MNMICVCSCLALLAFETYLTHFVQKYLFIFNKIKSIIKKKTDMLVWQPELTAPQRREHLLGAIETTISETRELNLEPYYRHSSTFYVRCIERADIMGD